MNYVMLVMGWIVWLVGVVMHEADAANGHFLLLASVICFCTSIILTTMKLHFRKAGLLK